MNILVLLGTARKDNVSARVYDALVNELKDKAELTLVQPSDVLTHVATARTKDLSATDSPLHKWQSQVEESDRIVMILPEYNHSFPGEWKMLVDALAPAVCKDKPVFLVTVSAGAFAGVRVADHVQPVLHTLGFNLQESKLHVAQVGEMYSKEGTIDESALTRLKSFVEAVVA